MNFLEVFKISFGIQTGLLNDTKLAKNGSADIIRDVSNSGEFIFMWPRILGFISE